MNNNNILRCLIVTLALLIKSLSAEEGKTMNTLQNKPVFELKFEGFGCIYLLEVNGVTVFTQANEQGKISSRLPINHYMKPNNNTFKISTWTDESGFLNPNAYVKVELIVSDHDTPHKEFSLGTISFDNSKNEDEEKYVNSSLSGRYSPEKAFNHDDTGQLEVFDIVFNKDEDLLEYSRRFNIPSSIPLWAFFSSDDLPDYDSMSDEEYYQKMDEFLVEYLKVQDAIKNNNIASILPMFEERNKELDAAFYNPQGTLSMKIKTALIDAANDTSAELVELNKDVLNFSRADNKKLVSLTRSDNSAAVGLDYKKIEGSYSFDMIFRMQDGKWILTR